MIGVTFGIGPGWPELARRCAGEMSACTGLDCRVIDHDPFGVSHPAWLKLKVFELLDGGCDDVLVFDADLIPLRTWDPQGIYERLCRPFMAVPDVDSVAVLTECVQFGIPAPGYYVNSGLFIAGRQHAPVLDAAFAYHPKLGSWHEQTALNLALLRSQTDVVRLPRRFNTLLWSGADDLSPDALRARPETVLHLASRGGDARAIGQLQQAVLQNS